MKRTLMTMAAAALLVLTAPVFADDYKIDTGHTFIQFKISHLGYSYVIGRFNDFEGTFTYDEKDPSKSRVEASIVTGSIDSSHAERDKHLRGSKFLSVGKYPGARFVSTVFEDQSNGKALLKGDLTLHGVTKPITLDVTHVGAGKDPWGGYRRGFEGTTRLSLKDFGIKGPGPTSQELEVLVVVEGIRT
ncbi:MAG: YceI family protein [Gammaproteobacteria bacterium]|nr:YceI family protein [Gammaproteobacteria bacterium]